MIPSLRALLIVMALVSAWSPPRFASAHPFHGSLMDAELNRETGNLECALRVQPIDLEFSLRQRSNAPVDLEKTKDVEAMISRFLVDAVRFLREKQPVRIKFVGYELDRKWVWVYFEVPLQGDWRNVRIENRVFMDRLDDQVNTINFRDGKRRWSVHCTAEHPSHDLAKPPARRTD